MLKLLGVDRPGSYMDNFLYLASPPNLILINLLTLSVKSICPFLVSWMFSFRMDFNSTLGLALRQQSISGVFRVLQLALDFSGIDIK